MFSRHLLTRLRHSERKHNVSIVLHQMASTDSRTLTKHEQLTLVISSKEKESSGPRFQQLAYKTRHHYDCTPSVCFKKTEAFINFTGNYNIRATSKSSPLWWMQAPSAYFPVPHLFSFCLFPLKISILYIPKGVSFFSIKTCIFRNLELSQGIRLSTHLSILPLLAIISD